MTWVFLQIFKKNEEKFLGIKIYTTTRTREKTKARLKGLVLRFQFAQVSPCCRVPRSPEL